MIGGLNKSTSSLAILAAAGLLVGGFASSSARAADLGGDCCADLEERVSELEATTIRHGNRKVSMTISGQVNQQLLWYDNGEESDVYVIDNDESSTRMNIKGSGTIRPGVTAGYQIEFDLQMGNNFSQSENDDDDGDTFQFRRAEWWVKRDDVGKLTVGQGSMAADGALEVSFSDAWLGGVGYGLAITNNYFTVYDSTSGTYLAGVSWAAIGTDMDTSRRNRVRYDSPTMQGFTFSASWGEDDEWDVALRYANEWNGLRVAAAIAYMDDADDNGGVTGFCNVASPASANGSPGNGPGCFERETYGGSIAFLHVPSGVHVEGGYAHRDNGVDEAWTDVGVNIQAVASAAGLQFDDESEHWWVAAGIQFRANSLGKSDISIQYIENENVGNIAALGVTQGFVGFDYTNWGIGFAQNIDAIGSQFYISYLHHEADLTGHGSANLAAIGAQSTIDADFEQINAGMRVRY